MMTRIISVAIEKISNQIREKMKFCHGQEIDMNFYYKK